MERKKRGRISLSPWFLLLALWLAAFSIVCNIPEVAWAYSGGDSSVAARLFGSTRVMIGQNLYERADDYFHRGVPHIKKKAFVDIFQKWSESIHPVAHVHAMGKSVYEIMPWLDFATRMDPHNIEAFLVAAFWLAGEGERPDLAFEALDDAISNNPKDYQLYGERGRIHMMLGNDERAEKSFAAAVQLWPSGRDPEDEGVRLDLARYLSYRSVLLQARGNIDDAIRYSKRAAEMMPGNEGIQQHVRELESGEASPARARQICEGLFPLRGSFDEEDCQRNEGSDQHHDHQHH